MQTIEKQISDLLYIHDCVIVPGFGGFVTNTKPATIVEETGMCLPPHREIGFNKNLSHNDGLLITHLCLHLDMAFDEARKLVDNFVQTISQDIKNGLVVKLNEIGEFRLDSYKNIIFTPNLSKNYMADAYGLPEFYFAKINPTHKTTEIFSKPLSNDYKRIIRKPILIGAMVVAGFFLFTPVIKDHAPLDNNYSSIISIPLTSSSVIDSSLLKKEKEEETVEVAPTAPQAIVAEPLLYHLIVASFEDKAQAEKHLAKYVAKGFQSAHIVSDSPNRFRVAIESFSNREEAFATMNSFKNQPEFQSVWLHKKIYQ